MGDEKRVRPPQTKKPSDMEGFCGAYEARTRDPMRDRHVF